MARGGDAPRPGGHRSVIRLAVPLGVGGSVDGLKEACREKGAVAYEIENHGVPGMSGGVGRALVEIQMY